MSASEDLQLAALANVRQFAQRARAASRKLATLSGAERNAVLERMAVALEQASAALLAANAEDLRAAEDLREAEALSPATLARLRLDTAKLREMVEQVRSVAALQDPLGRVLDAVELDDQGPTADMQQGLHLHKISVPLGVLAVIFEARPDAVTQIAALALKSGNAVILKAGREVEHTARALVQVLRESLHALQLPEDAVSMVFGREQVAELLAAHGLIDMVIPRGSKQLVEYVQANTRIPVLGHAEGVCHIYVDRAANPELAMRVIADAKLDYPAACNAVETVLVHEQIAASFLPRLADALRAGGVRLRGDAAVRASTSSAEVMPVEDWHTEFGDAELAISVVASMEAAIEHIHTHGSAHTEAILTEDAEAAEQFLREVDSASVVHNASTRFADGFRYGLGAEVGISTSKLHARGPVGLEGLTTSKYVLRGHGHVAGAYRGAGARAFTHRREGGQ